jgi:glycosyltransferase involved in cell wall biosynthesis
MAGIHIGVNALYLIPGGVGGTEIYLRSLLCALAAIDNENRYTVFTNAETGPDLVPARANFQHAPQPVHAVNRPARILWEQTRLPREAARRGVQVLFNPGFTAPIFSAIPNVTVFHDLQHKRHPENFRWFDLPFWRILLNRSAHRSCKLIAVSSATADDLTRFYGIAKEKIQVVPHGVDERFFEIGRQRATSEPLLLCVSTLHPHKNLDTLLRAFASFHKAHPGFRLTIAGLRGFHTNELETLRTSLGLSASVEFTGWIPREDLYDLFRRAAAFVYPSRFEGFGMPVLEALAAGIPTVCSNAEPMSGIAGTAAFLFDPAHIDELARALDTIVTDQKLRARLIDDGPARAAQFSWPAAAQATLDTLLSAV